MRYDTKGYQPRCTLISTNNIQGRDPGFQVGRVGGHLKKLRRAEVGAKIFGVFRVKNHDFTPKNHIFSNFRGARLGCAPSLLDPPLVFISRKLLPLSSIQDNTIITTLEL
jgi:hypothetical protein